MTLNQPVAAARSSSRGIKARKTGLCLYRAVVVVGVVFFMRQANCCVPVESTNIFLAYITSTAIGWRPIRGAPGLSPLDSWDRLQQSPAAQTWKEAGTEDGWMDGL